LFERVWLLTAATAALFLVFLNSSVRSSLVGATQVPHVELASVALIAAAMLKIVGFIKLEGTITITIAGFRGVSL